MFGSSKESSTAIGHFTTDNEIKQLETDLEEARTKLRQRELKNSQLTKKNRDLEHRLESYRAMVSQLKHTNPSEPVSPLAKDPYLIMNNSRSNQKHASVLDAPPHLQRNVTTGLPTKPMSSILSSKKPKRNEGNYHSVEPSEDQQSNITVREHSTDNSPKKSSIEGRRKDSIIGESVEETISEASYNDTTTQHIIGEGKDKLIRLITMMTNKSTNIETLFRNLDKALKKLLGNLMIRANYIIVDSDLQDAISDCIEVSKEKG